MPYVKGLGYLKRNGRVTRSTMVKSGPKKTNKLTSGLLLRGPGGVVHVNRSPRRFENTRTLLRRLTRF